MMLVVLALAVAGASAQATGGRCCFDNQYTAVLGEAGGTVINGNAMPVDGSVELSYDFYKKVQATVTTERIQGSDPAAFKTTKRLDDYANRVVYLTDENGNCVSYAQNSQVDFVMTPACVPAEATYLGNGTFGYGTETLHIDAWEWTEVDAFKNFTLKLAVTDTCVPVVEARYGYIIHPNQAQESRKQPLELTYFYTNYHPGILNADNLQPPAVCPPPGSVQLPDGPIGK